MNPTAQLLVLALAPVLLASTPFERGLDSQWINRTATELVEAYGEPDMILETSVNGVVLQGSTYTIMYVYTSDPEHRRGCIAAYVVEHDTGLILRYRCRDFNRTMVDGTGIK